MNPETAYDAELVRRFNAGDESAFVEMITRHRPKIYALALSTLRNADDAEEIANDTFLRAHRGLANFRGDSSLKTWLYQVALNLARNRYWYWWRRRRHVTVSLDTPITPNEPDTFVDTVRSEEIGPLGELTVSELAAAIERGMEQLSEPHREILTLRNVLQQDYQAIADALRIPVGSVKSRIARARLKLRQAISGSFPEFAGEEKLV